MNFVIITFIVSLLGLTYLVGRKLVLLNRAKVSLLTEETILIAPDLENIKSVAGKKFRKYGYILLLITLRLSIKSGNYLKRFWRDVWDKIESKLNKNKPAGEKEISRFLKSVSEYKNKLKSIRERVREEERLE